MVLGLFGVLVALTPLAATAATQNVAVQDFLFEPATREIVLGDTVVWKNNGQQQHTVTFDDGLDSNPGCTTGGLLQDCLAPGETFDRTFTQADDFKYRCKLHPQMTGVVVVAPAATTTTAAPTTTLPPTTTTLAPTTTTTRQLATSSTQAPTTTTSTLPEDTTTTLTPNESPEFDPGDGEDEGDDGTAAPVSDDGGGGGGGTVALIVAALLAVAGGGGILLWRLRPRAAP